MKSDEEQQNERNARNACNSVATSCRIGNVQSIRSVLCLLDDRELLERSRMYGQHDERGDGGAGLIPVKLTRNRLPEPKFLRAGTESIVRP